MSYYLKLLEHDDFDTDGDITPFEAWGAGVPGTYGSITVANSQVTASTLSSIDNQWSSFCRQPIAPQRDISGIGGGAAGACRIYQMKITEATMGNGGDSDPDRGSSAGMVLGAGGANNRNWLFGWYAKQTIPPPGALWINYCAIRTLQAGFDSGTVRWESSSEYSHNVIFRVYVNDTGGNVGPIESNLLMLPNANIAFYYSSDGGTTFTYLYHNAINLIASGITYVGGYGCSIQVGLCGTPDPAIDASVTFDYLNVYGYEATVDADPPYVANAVPANGDTVAPTTSIDFDIIDDGEGVDSNSVLITVDGTTVWQNEAAKNSWTVVTAAIVGGYSFLLTSPTPFPPSSVVDVSIYAADIVLPTPNSDTTNYSFNINPLDVCSTPSIGSNFVLNHYICLPTNYTDTTKTVSKKTLPFSLLRRPHLLASGSTIG